MSTQHDKHVPDSRSPKANGIRRMFDVISPQYDLFNRILSLGIDQGLRRKAVRFAHVPPEGKLLDLCTGTGDLLIAAHKHDSSIELTGIDFSEEMLAIARRKVPNSNLVQGDCLKLPVKSASVDAITVCWGMRNLTDIPAALAEMVRVLKPGGRLVVLEFSRPPRKSIRKAFDLAFRLFSGIISRFTSQPAAYGKYLPGSIERFPPAEEISQFMTDSGLRVEGVHRRFFGELCFHVAVKDIQST